MTLTPAHVVLTLNHKDQQFDATADLLEVEFALFSTKSPTVF